MSLSRRGFIRSVGMRGASPGVRRHGSPPAVGKRWLARQATPRRARWCRRRSAKSASAATRTRSGPVAPLLTRSPRSSRRPAGTRFNSKPGIGDLIETIAKKWGVKSENVTVGAGSGELLRNAVRAFTSPTKPLVTAQPSFESPFTTANQIGTPVKYISVTADLKLDLDAMAAAAPGAGMIFVCNPNNPTATAHGLQTITDFVAKVRKTAPDTVILLDEAYYDYVTDPSYKTGVPLAMETPNLFVARTFSKAYGMAGLRMGYAIGRTELIKELARWGMTPFNMNTLGLAGAVASLNDQAHIDQERARNTEVRNYTVKVFEDLGCKPTDAQTNFLFVNIHRPAKEFRDACKQQGVQVGRDFPPYEKTHARVSIGTMEEMRQAAEVFKKALGAATTTAAR